MLRAYQEMFPQVDATAWVADSACVVGEASIGEHSSVWYNATIRADVAPVIIGKNSNVQDNAAIHEDYGVPTIIGDNVTIGHAAVVHGCVIEDNCLIGMGAVVLDRAHIGHGSIIAAGAVVPPGMQVPPYSQVMGVPGRVVKQLDGAAEQNLIAQAAAYVRMSDGHR